MKVRDSGMPEEEMWAEFFDPDFILSSFGIGKGTQNIVEFGCGYGTFTLPAARLTKGMVHAFDIEEEKVALVQEKCRFARIRNVRAALRDFVGLGTGLQDSSIDCALLFNILHHEDPVSLLSEAYRVLRLGGIVAVIHWNHDPTTPRGPSLDIRPRPEQCIAWGNTAGFLYDKGNRFEFPPYHYGLLFSKTKEN